MEDKKTMRFGEKYRVGNYEVIKFNKTLRKQEVAALRLQTGIPKELWKSLQRAQLPYVKVNAISGIWGIEFCCNTSVYRLIDGCLGEGGEQNETMLAHLFNMWYMDTAVPGDEEYQETKAKAFKEFMERHKAKEVSEEEDKNTLEELENEEKAKATIVDMANELKNGKDNEG